MRPLALCSGIWHTLLMKLAAVSLIVPDYDAGIAFYCGIMGFELAEDFPQGDKRWVRVNPPGGGASFILAQAATPQQSAAIGNQGGGRVWLFLQSDDFDVDYNRLKAAGVTFEETPRSEVYGKVAVFRDPFGNRWDLLGAPE